MRRNSFATLEKVVDTLCKCAVDGQKPFCDSRLPKWKMRFHFILKIFFWTIFGDNFGGRVNKSGVSSSYSNQLFTVNKTS